MSAEAEALLRLKVVGADEVLASIRQVAAEVRGLNVPGYSGHGSQAQGVPVSGPGVSNPPPAQPSVPVTAVSGAAAGVGPGVAQAAAAVSVQAGNAAIVAQAAASAGPAMPSHAYFDGQRWSPVFQDVQSGRWVDGSTGAMLLSGGLPAVPGGSGAGGRHGVAYNPTWRDVAAAFGGMQTYHQAAALGQAWAGGAGQAEVAGRPFRAESLAPAAVGLGLTALGWAVAGPVGGLAMGTVGAMAQSYLQPIADRNVRQSHLADLFDAYGMSRPRGSLTTGQLGLMESSLAAGHFEAARMAERLSSRKGGFDWGEWDWMNWRPMPGGGVLSPVKRLPGGWQPDVKGFFKDSEAGRAASAELVRQMMDPSVRLELGRIPDPENPDDVAAVIRIGARTGDLRGRLLDPSLLEPGDPRSARLSKTMEEAGPVRLARAQQLIESPARMSLLDAEERSAAVDMMIAERTEGSQGVRRAARDLYGVMRRRAAEQRNMAAHATTAYEKAELLSQAAATEKAADFAFRTAHLQAETQEIAAVAARRHGEAGRGFDRALYGGANAYALPWGDVADAVRREAGDEARFLRENWNVLSPAERMQRQERIAELRHRETFEIPRQREQAEIRADFAEAKFRGAQATRHWAGVAAYGSAEESAYGSREGALFTAREELTVVERTLAVRQMLTAEERKGLEARRESLMAARTMLEADQKRAVIAARADTEIHRVNMGSFESRASLIRGAGGRDATYAMLDLVSRTDASIATLQRQRRQLLDEGFAAESEAVQGVEQQIHQLRLNREVEVRSSALVPMTPEHAMKMDDVRTRLAFAEAGYGGSAANVRALLQEALSGTKEAASQQKAHRKALIADGTWTDAMEVDHRRAMNQLSLEALQMQMRMDEGWDQRLISQAYNMPDTGRILLSGFNRTNAAILGGVTHRSFGGTEEQTRSFRTIQMPAGESGRAGSFADRAMGGGEVKLSIEVRVRDSEGREIGDARTRAQLFLDQFSGLSSIEGNPDERRKPSP